MRRKGIMCLPAVICLLGILLSAPYCRAEAAAVQEIVREKMIPLEDKQLSEKDKTEKNQWRKALSLQKTSESAATLDKIPLSFKNASTDLLMQYVTEDQKKVKLLNNNILYSYDIQTGLVTTEHTFGTAQFKQGVSMFYGSQDVPSAYIREDKGLLYYGYNSYQNTFSGDEIMNIVVYDLNTAAVQDTFSLSGNILHCVGADKKGNIYIGTDDYIKSEDSDNRDAQSLIILDETGEKVLEKETPYPINEFSGFCADGTFYYIDEYMAYSQLGYPNLMGRLMRGSYSEGKVTLGEKYLTYAKNIYFSNYRNPVEIINDTVLVTSMGGFYPLDKITDSSFSHSLAVEKNLEMGDEYDYLYNAGVSTVIRGDLVYTLMDNKTIFVYSMSTKEKKQVFYAKNKIFNMKALGDNLIALETDGTSFSYEQIHLSDFQRITTKSYDLNEVMVYQGRTKAQIESRFHSALPSNMDQTLFQSAGSASGTYKESVLTTATRKNAVSISNYYRWLAGLTNLGSAADNIWTRAGKGAVLLASSDFSHAPGKPSDMPDAFYNEAEKATGSSNIAMNYYADQYKLIGSIRQFLDDTGDVVPGHRNTFFTRNATTIAYGIHGRHLCQTVGYEDNPNPSGTAKIGNNEMAYAWPAPGVFPAEELSPSAYWTVCLNTDKLNLSAIGLQVTIEDLGTGKKFVRKTAATGLYISKFWGYYVCFAPPELPDGVNSYAGRKYRVTLSNLSDADAMPADLTYITDFFPYSSGIQLKYEKDEDKDVFPEDIVVGFSRKKVAFRLSNSAKGIKVSWDQLPGAQSYTVYRNGKKVRVVKGTCYVDTGASKNGRKYTYYVRARKGNLTSKKPAVKSCYFMSRPSIRKLKRLSHGRMKVTWKKNGKASGYQIRYRTGSKTKTVTVNGKKKGSVTLKKLKKKKYQVNVRCYKKAGKSRYYSAWSNTKKK